jgi:hypothetical protein
MMKHGPRVGVAFLAASLSAAAWVGLAAQQPVSPVSSDESGGPQLRISTSSSVYRMGELIPLELSFTSQVPNRYQVNMATYDRSGRMGYEKFLVEPASGTADPIVAYFRSGSFFLGGGLTNFTALSKSPYVMHLNLNEWVRFDRPGHYRLTVTSQRVSDISSGKLGFGGTGESVRSNTLELEVVEPDEAWQMAELKRILGDFDQSPPAKEDGFSSEQRIAAITRLRYLGSAEAARELARHLRGDENQVDWACMLGLIGSPNKRAGYDEMKKLLADPDFPVSSMFLTTMSILPLSPTDAPEILRQERDANWGAAWSDLLTETPSKRGKASGVSADTLLKKFALSQKSAADVSQEEREKLVPLLIEHFGDLETREQQLWLEDWWPTVRTEKWLPTLRSIAAEYADYPVPYAPNEEPAYDYFKLSGEALMRWYELDPKGARPAVLAEIVRPKPRFSANTLGMLPDKVLPDQERAIADHFAAEDAEKSYAVESNLASLLNRYADAAVLAEVLPKIKRKVGPRWACDAENDAVAYVERVDPQEGSALMEKVPATCRSFPHRGDLP